MVEFPLPGDEERNRLVRLYFEKYVLQPAIEGAGGGRKISVEEMDYGALCTEIAVAAGGMPGSGAARASWSLPSAGP